MTWAASARIFLDHVTQAVKSARKITGTQSLPPIPA
jgi:hypothetical protein